MVTFLALVKGKPWPGQDAYHSLLVSGAEWKLRVSRTLLSWGDSLINKALGRILG